MTSALRPAAGRALCLGLDRLFEAVSRRRPTREAGGRRTVLIVRLDAFGDFLLWTPSAKRLRDLFPRETHELVIVANRLWAPLAKETAWFDRVIAVDRDRLTTSLGYRWRVWKEIRQVGAGVCFQPTYSRELLFGDAAVRVSGAGDRVGSTGDLSNRTEPDRRVGDRWYTRLVPSEGSLTHELARNAEILRGFGLPDAKEELPFLPVQGTLPEGFGAGPWYVLFVGASFALKRWPTEHFARLAERIYAETGLRGVIGGGPGEEGIGEHLQRLASAPLKNWVGKTSLRQLVAVVRRASFLVSNDTGAIHLAAATGTPAVCVLGGGHFGRFLPYGVESGRDAPAPASVFHCRECFDCNWRCVHPVGTEDPAPCIAGVSVDEVWVEISKILEARHAGA